MSNQNSSETLEEQEIELTEPPKYNVIMLNDDRTTMEFVIIMLITFFEKNPMDAHTLCMQIHEKGKALVGTYSDEDAKSRVESVRVEAQNNNYPLTCEIEEET